MKKLLLLVVFALLMVTSASGSEKWPNEPKEFRGVPFGSSQSAMREKFDPGRCVGRPNDVCLNHAQRIGEAATDEVYSFEADRFVDVYITFASGRYEYLRDIFVEKYGAPTDTKKTLVKTPGGAEFENERLTWFGDSVMVDIERFGRTVTKGTAHLSDRAWMERSAKEREEKKHKAAKSF
jgi:hypothetical protein